MRIELYEELVERAQRDTADGAAAIAWLQTQNNGERYLVPDQSVVGRVYEVRFVGRGDCDGVFLWECNCAAGRRGRSCEHFRRVVAASSQDPCVSGGKLT